MRLGIDLDNTIICYDSLFRRLALERDLIPATLPATKQAIRDHLRGDGRESEWTLLQGLAYGSRILEAEPFPDVLEFLATCGERSLGCGKEWWIISHRSPQPYAGPPCDLHDAARRWLVDRSVISSAKSDRLRLETTREAKLARIADLRCEVFIDDLPELLTDPQFPDGVRRILFDPANQNVDHSDYERVSSWSAMNAILTESSRPRGGR